ncbi:MAG: hypothetical protein ACI81L_001159 [Verrucomicrobiales bacterium]|jgi:hypothetical protein
MTVVMLSEWEMKTHGQGALRVLGVPFGVSERAMELFVWAHAVQRGAVEYLVASQVDIRATAGAEISVLHEEGSIAQLDANGQTIFTVGPAAIDLCCALTDTHASSSVSVTNVSGLQFAAELASRGADKGLACTVTGPLGSWCAGPVVGLTRIDASSDDLVITCALDPLLAGGEPIDVSRVRATAQREGYPTESGAGQTFLDLAHQLWLPTSERSRAQGSEGDKG